MDNIGGGDCAFMASEGAPMAALSKWIVDSGATKHMTPYKCSFATYEPIEATSVLMGDNGVVEAIGMGSIVVEVVVGGKTKKITFKDVLHVPKMKSNLLSVSKLVMRGFVVHFNVHGCVVKSLGGDVVAKGFRNGNLYFITCKKVNGVEVAAFAQFTKDEDKFGIWHGRLGHLNVKAMKVLK